MSKRSLRVYFVTHENGHLTGILLRTWDWFFDRPPPSAYGTSEDHVYRQLEAQLHAMNATGEDSIERYLWDESFEIRTTTVDVHPQSAVKKRLVIGKRRIPLHLSYLVSKVAEGGYRVLIPRFGWWFVIEDLDIARDVLRQLVSAALLGEKPRSVYDFRLEGSEYVRAWSPRVASKEERTASHAGNDEDFTQLRQVGEELVEKAAKGRLPAVLGMSAEFERSLPLFERTPPASILLVGGPGVGKTSFVYRLARHLLTQRRSKLERSIPRLWSTSVDRILAGMTFLGMWQERCLGIVKELSSEGDYLYVGSMLPFLRAQPDGSSVAEIFHPALRAEELSLIAECTEQELEHCERRAAALLASFQIVRLTEPAASSMSSFLGDYESRREATVRIHPAGRKRLVQHLAMFRRDLLFPGKLVRFLDWLYQQDAGRGTEPLTDAAVTRVAMEGPPPPAAPPASPRGPARILYPRDVSEAYARYSGLPLQLVADEIPAGADRLGAELSTRIIGQPRACATAARVLARFKAGLNDPERPCGTLLFVGPTGVGKTELAKQLARTMFGDESRMIRLDMSEYMLAGSSYRLLDTGPGVTSLAQLVRQQPLSLVLLDEIEKAHREVFDLLLGVLGEGRLSDVEGRLVDFRMTLIIMTSNLGVADAPQVGFGDSPLEGGAERRVRQHFRPEFFNRIDHVVPFRNLAPEDVLRIVDLEIEKARQRTGLVRRGLRLDVVPEARRLLADLGYHPTRGARPLRRVIEERVITPIAAAMAADPTLLERGVTVRCEADSIAIAFEPR